MTAYPAAIVDLLDAFALMDDWEERYRYVIELGKALPGLSEADKTEENRVKGCTSQVWLVENRSGDAADPILTYQGDSDAHIVRGLVAIVMAFYSGRPASEIAKADALALFQELGFGQHLSPQRSNGLRSMVERIRRDATAILAHSS